MRLSCGAAPALRAARSPVRSCSPRNRSGAAAVRRITADVAAADQGAPVKLPPGARARPLLLLLLAYVAGRLTRRRARQPARPPAEVAGAAGQRPGLGGVTLATTGA